MLIGHPMANNAGFQLVINGMDGQNLRIQTSSDLKSGIWTDAASVTNCQPLQSWTDTNIGSVTSRFYRLVSP